MGRREEKDEGTGSEKEGREDETKVEEKKTKRKMSEREKKVLVAPAFPIMIIILLHIITDTMYHVHVHCSSCVAIVNVDQH